MSPSTGIKIDLAETFQLLPNAPIVEAAVEVKARALTSWEQGPIMEAVKSKLPDYPNVRSQEQMVQQFTFGETPSAKTQERRWKGLRVESGDGRQVAQFNFDNFVFGRLKPYESWDRLNAEVQRLWGVHVELAQPAELERIGLRFINKITLPANDLHFQEYMQAAPAAPRGLELPFNGFLHHDMLGVPGHPYAVNIIRTIQPPSDSASWALILDVDVFTTQPFEFRDDVLAQRLPEMRWLKNKAFFGSITPKTLELFRK